jgi:hypothetical protein
MTGIVANDPLVPSPGRRHIPGGQDALLLRDANFRDPSGNGWKIIEEGV